MREVIRAIPWNTLRSVATAVLFSVAGALLLLAGALGLGWLRVRLHMGPTVSMLDGRMVAVVVGAMGAMLGVVTAAWMTMGRAVRGAILVADALTRAGSQGFRGEHLSMDERHGAVAKAWNELLVMVEKLRSSDALARVSAARQGTSGERDELRNVCDAMWQGMLVLNEDGTIRYANGAAATLLAADQNKMMGANLKGLLPPDESQEILQTITTQRSPAKFEIAVGSESAQSVLRLTSRPVRRGDSGHTMVVIEDITQQRAADTAWKAMVAQVSHELRTPLTNIQLYVEEMQDDQDQDPAVRARALNVINQEARRLERVISDMLSMSEIESGKLSLRLGDVRLEPLFDELKIDYQASADEKRLAFHFELPPKLPHITADRDKLALVLHNLLSNAVKYTPEGGDVTVRVDSDGPQLRIEVSDTGFGISEEEQERVFEKFYRARDERVGKVTGTGLGLAIAREVARQHGGEITLQSKVNEGSTFTLTLPVLKDAA